MNNYFLYYVTGVNAISFLLCGMDKRFAKKKRRRISENTLLFVSAIGGSIGFYIGMKLFSHKTLHKKFSIGIPSMILAHGMILVLLDRNGFLY